MKIKQSKTIHRNYQLNWISFQNYFICKLIYDYSNYYKKNINKNNIYIYIYIYILCLYCTLNSRATNNNFAQGKLPIFANKGATILQIEVNNANISDTLDRVHSVLSDANKLVRLRLGGNDLSGML